MELSVVIPVFNEEPNVEALCARLHESLSTIGKTYEVLLVDDGSRDGTWPLLCKQAGKYPGFRLIRFRRNYGQTAAMAAGIKHACGDVIVTLDADLQNDPADIPRLLEAMTPDVDVVSGWRRKRQDPFLNRRLPSILANALISAITGVRLHDYGCTLKAYRREVIQNVRLYGEMHRFIPALASWVGSGVREVVVDHHPRRHGTSKYGISRTLRVVLDLMTVKFLLRYSHGPMQMFGRIGVGFAAPGILLLAVMVATHLSFLVFGTELGADLIKRPFWIMTAFMLVFMGMQFFSLGLLAEIQIRTYHEAQSKDTYVIREIFESASAGGTTG